MNSSQDCVDIPPSMQKELGSLATSNWGNIRVIREKKSGNNKKGREAVPALGVGQEVRRPRAQAEGPKPRYTNPQVL